MIANNIIKPLIRFYRPTRKLRRNRSVIAMIALLDFIVHELVPEMINHINKPQADSRAILGVSYGGKISTTLVLKPEIFIV